MTLLYLLGGIVALELLVYLGMALLKMRCVGLFAPEVAPDPSCAGLGGSGGTSGPPRMV